MRGHFQLQRGGMGGGGGDGRIYMGMGICVMLDGLHLVQWVFVVVWCWACARQSYQPVKHWTTVELSDGVKLPEL
jgi:hypothetical protein